MLFKKRVVQSPMSLTKSLQTSASATNEGAEVKKRIPGQFKHPVWRLLDGKIDNSKATSEDGK
jgi:hypothetical protein